MLNSKVKCCMFMPIWFIEHSSGTIVHLHMFCIFSHDKYVWCQFWQKRGETADEIHIPLIKCKIKYRYLLDNGKHFQAFCCEQITFKQLLPRGRLKDFINSWKLALNTRQVMGRIFSSVLIRQSLNFERESRYCN